MDARQFLSELERLNRQFGQQPANLGCYQAEECERCGSCMFCESCSDCFKCTHCVNCVGCSGCSHCKDCQYCHASAYCENSQFCIQSAYLFYCTNCSDCTYCFGCVGLVKKEFAILNVRYNRKDFFELTQKLREELAQVARAQAGRPPPVPRP